MYDFTKAWCFRMAALSRRISRSYNNICSQYGITGTQSFVLMDLLNHDGSSVKNIAARIKLESPAVTGVIDRLCKEALVERIADSSDRRSLQIFLTGKGRALAEEFVPACYEYNQMIQAGFDPDEIDRVENYLHRLEQKC